MKFSIKKSIILEQLVNVNRAISPKNIIPVLNGIKFELDEQGLQLTASDSDLTIKSLIKPKDIESVDKEGSIVIQAKYIIDIVKSMPGEVINFEVVDGSSIIIYCNNTKYNLNCLNSNDYPQIQMEENKNTIKLKGEDLKRMIKQTIFAVSTQESRPLLTGVNININGNILEFITTDSLKALYTKMTGRKSNIHKYHVLRWDKPSNTIPAHLYKDGMRHIHPDPKQARSITVREAARLQTFADDFIFLGPSMAQYKMIGNAVPSDFAKVIAKALHIILKKYY